MVGETFTNLITSTLAEKEGIESLNFYVKPSLDCKLGDAGSNVCHELAALLKRPPEECAQQLIGHMSDQERFDVRFLDGFLNFELKGKGWNLIPGECTLQSREQILSIFVSPFVETLDRNEYIRLLAHAFVQIWTARSLEISCELYVGVNLLMQDPSLKEICQQFQQCAAQIFQDHSHCSKHTNHYNSSHCHYNLRNKPARYRCC